MASDKKKIKGAPFKLNNHPKNLFEENPFHSDKKLPPISDAKPKKDTLKPFKPSHPPKLVSLHSICLYILLSLIMTYVHIIYYYLYIFRFLSRGEAEKFEL